MIAPSVIRKMPTGPWRFASVSLRSALCSFSALISSTPHFRQKLSSGRISDPQIQQRSCTKPALTRISLTVNLNILRRIEAYLSILAPLGIVAFVLVVWLLSLLASAQQEQH